MAGYFGQNDTLKLTNLLRLKSFEQPLCVWKVMLSTGTTMRMEEGDLEDGRIFVNYCWNDSALYRREPF